MFVMHRDAYLFMQYNTLTDQWTELPCPVKPAYDSTMVLHNNCLLVCGGDGREFNTCIQSYNIANRTWSAEKQTFPLRGGPTVCVVRVPVPIKVI